MINLDRKYFYIIVIILFSLSVSAEELPGPFILSADNEILLDNYEKLLIASGNASFEMEDILVKADQITVFSNENFILAEGTGLTIKIGEQLLKEAD